jgi:kynureninase
VITLTEDYLREHVWPKFSRVMARDEVYLANHSLGRPLDQMASDVARGTDLWYSAMDGAWEPWLAEMNQWRAGVAKLIGLSKPDRIVPKTSAGQGLRAALNSFPQDRPVPVVTTRGEFDSIDFILKAYGDSGRASVTWVEPASSEGSVPLYSVDSLIDALAPGRQGLVVVSQVFFGTGQILQEVEKLVQVAHERGWRVLVDLYHAAGVIPLDFEAMGADFGIGGSYKYLRGGPGACWLALGDGALSLQTIDTGWFAKKNTFGYERSDIPQFADGGNGWLESTPPVLMPYQAKSGLELVLSLGIDALREYSLRQQARMRQCFRSNGIELFEPGDPSLYGAFSLLHRTDAEAFSQRLKARGVNTDSRGEFVRFGPDILNSDDELARAADIVKTLI